MSTRAQLVLFNLFEPATISSLVCENTDVRNAKTMLSFHAALAKVIPLMSTAYFRSNVRNPKTIVAAQQP